MSGCFRKPGAPPLSPLSLLLLAAGQLACGENVLVGSWLRSSNDAGVEHLVIDAGANPQGVYAAHARADKKRKSEQKANEQDRSEQGGNEQDGSEQDGNQQDGNQQDGNEQDAEEQDSHGSDQDTSH